MAAAKELKTVFHRKPPSAGETTRAAVYCGLGMSVPLAAEFVFDPALLARLSRFVPEVPEDVFLSFQQSLLGLLEIKGMNGPAIRARVVFRVSINQDKLERLRTLFVPANNVLSAGELPFEGNVLEVGATRT
jgi:hypothetical protein